MLEEYQKCMVGMKHNLKQTSEIAESAAGPKTRLEKVLKSIIGIEVPKFNVSMMM